MIQTLALQGCILRAACSLLQRSKSRESQPPAQNPLTVPARFVVASGLERSGTLCPLSLEATLLAVLLLFSFLSALSLGRGPSFWVAVWEVTTWYARHLFGALISPALPRPSWATWASLFGPPAFPAALIVASPSAALSKCVLGRRCADATGSLTSVSPHCIPPPGSLMRGC